MAIIVDKCGHGRNSIGSWGILSKFPKACFVDCTNSVWCSCFWRLDDLHSKIARTRNKRDGVGQKQRDIMKIAFIVSQFPALSETFILNQITGLLDRGKTVDIFATNQRNETKIHLDVEKYNLLSRTYYRKPHNKLGFLIRCIFLLLTNFHRSPVNILRALNIFKFGKDALSLSLFYTYVCFLRHGPYDIIHCHFGDMGNFALKLKKVGLHKTKVITSFYGNDLGRYLREKGSDVYYSLFNEGDLFLALSEDMRKRLIECGCPDKRIVIHHLGIKPKLFKFKGNENKVEKAVKILTVARLEEKKGLEFSIRAVRKVCDEIEEIEYMIVGAGPLRMRLEMLCVKLGISQKVRFFGPMVQSEIINMFQRANIFILASATASDGDVEGTPTVLLEAMSGGLPVISTFHAGIPEQIIDGECGFLVPERDVDALAERIKYLVQHREIWPEMGQVGRRIVVEHFNIDKLANRLLGIYEKVINED